MVLDTLVLSFYKSLADVENGVRRGWDESKGLWFSHESLEGGTPTIAYGHKLSNEEFTYDVFKAGISELDAFELLVDDYTIAIAESNLEWRKRGLRPDLEDKYRLILGDIVFNTGSLSKNGKLKWPKLVQAMSDGDDQRVYEESLRWYTTSDGVKKPLTYRSIKLCRAVGLDFQP